MKEIDDVAKGLWTDIHGVVRCRWCRASPAYVAYHDAQWGFPVLDDRTLFEKVCLEGFQAGLSWLTILNKREAFRQGFANFEPLPVSRFTAADVKRLLGDAGIVRHRGKIESTINNAKRALQMQDEFGSLCTYFWLFEAQSGARGGPSDSLAIEALQLSADLRRRGWTFVGPTTMYALMQAMGLINDHRPQCFVHDKVSAARRALGA